MQPSRSFDEHDGKWSTFFLDVGGSNTTGPQTFRAVISTSGSQTWLPNSAACSLYANFKHIPSDCPNQRGIGTFDAQPSTGYVANRSDTVSGASSGLFGASLGSYANSNLTAVYGPPFGSFAGNTYNDFFYLRSTSDPKNISSSQKALIISESSLWYLLPTIGLGHARTITDAGTSDPPIQAMYNGGLIPSQSWGYTAGASYGKFQASRLTHLFRLLYFRSLRCSKSEEV